MKFEADKAIAWLDRDAPEGVSLHKVHFGPNPTGLGGFQVAVGSSSRPLTRQELRTLHRNRKGHTQSQLVVAIVAGSLVQVFGPGDQSQPIEISVELATRQLQAVLLEPDVLAASERFTGFRKAHDSAGVAGFTNSGLFSSHHITSNVPKRTDWGSLAAAAAPLLSKRGQQLIEGLGFTVQRGPNGAMLLSVDGHPPRAVAVLLEDSEQFDSKTQRFHLAPVAFGLAVASRQELPWLVVLRKDQIRLYPGRDGVGVGSKGQAETFFEVDLSIVDAEYAALLPLVFSAAALAPEGSADQLLADSARFASQLGARLRERVYGEIVPPLAVAVANKLAARTGLTLDTEGLALAYRVTLRILFRLLFQAYAEDRGLLPSGRNEGFDANSLKTNAQRLLQTGPESFGDSSTFWFDLVQVWNAIDQGNPQWQIPAYNGGLFSTDPVHSPDGALIKELELPDSVLGPALKSLLIDVSEDGVLGPVDFRSLSVREFGTIYEGLLESSLSLAEQDLTVDKGGAWVPAKSGDDVLAPAGSVYFHSASGERKATGSYFTPKVVVDHLIERSLVPVLSEHLDKIATLLEKGDAVGASRQFFDFRVADLAMGSGHFLVAAVDKIEAMMRTFLTDHTVPGVTEELLRLAETARDALGSDDVAKSEVDEVALLRRQIARRCIYGLDINEMAVELARLAIWIHTFVPGLPMSNLDHGLVCADSLTGIGTIDEALDALQPDRGRSMTSFLEIAISDNLDHAKRLLTDVANASEANKAEVQEAAKLAAQAKQAAEPTRRLLDLAVAVRTGKVKIGGELMEEELALLAARPEVDEVFAQLRPAHMPYLFPEVFLRDRPGFDVLLGNPPWEKVKVETDQWWGLRMPGLRSMPQAQKNAALLAFRESRPDLEAEFAAEQEHAKALNAVIKSGPFKMGAGDTDLYQAFAWRNWQLSRRSGRFGLVLPRGALSGSGLAEWRKDILKAGTFADVCFLVNKQQWVFPEVHPQYTVGLVVAQRGAGELVRWSGPFASEREFLAGRDNMAEVPTAELAAWSTSAAFPLIPDRKSAEVFLQMKQSPRFDDVRPDWEFRPNRELDATNDKAVLEFDLDDAGGRIPVVTGASYNLWNPDYGPPYAYANPGVLRNHLGEKLHAAQRGAKSAYAGMVFAGGALPMDRARIAFRDIARPTDTRTMLCCLLPPGVSAVHKSPVLVRRRGGATSEAFLLGVMGSIPFDWMTRRWVELTMSFEIVNAMPVPPYGTAATWSKRVTELSGRLAAVDERYAEWAAEVGVPVGSVKSPAEKDDLITELDALVSLLYGLSED